MDNTNRSVNNSIKNLKEKILADNTCHWLFENRKDLLDDILSHSLLIDYFNVFLSLPIFGQRVLCHRRTRQFDFDPPLIVKSQNSEQVYEETKKWLIHCRLDHYIRTDIYIESLLSLLLTHVDDKKESSETLHTFINPNPATNKDESYMFSTVADVRKFHQFLQSTSGINYWNFFIDSMRLLQSRYSPQHSRIDISYLNFIYKYHSRQNEFRSITIDLNNNLIPDATTPDSIWFQMAINAMHQLRLYWIPRYQSQLSPLKQPSSKSNPITLNSRASKTDKQTNNTDQPLNNLSKLNFEIPSYPSSDRSIADYAIDANSELFYHILVSDSMAGSPFLDFILHSVSKPDVIQIQTCIQCITDAEVLLSLPLGKLKKRIVQQFISRYLEVTAGEKLPHQIFDILEEQRNELIEGLIKNDDENQYYFLWKFLLKITTILMPYFLNYIKFDRFRFLIKGKISNINLIIYNLHYVLPSINFDLLQQDQQQTNSAGLNQAYADKTEIAARKHLTNCYEVEDNLWKLFIKNRYSTTEKQINTDQRCIFRSGERFSPLTDHEFQEELNQLNTNLEPETIKTILGESFKASVISHPKNITTLIGKAESYSKIKQESTVNEHLQLDTIEKFTCDIINSAEEIFQIDRFVSNIIDESFHRFQQDSSISSIKSYSSSSSSSSLPSISDETFSSDSSSSSTETFQNMTTNNLNMNALTEITKLQKPIERKIFSIYGSYFINSPSIIKPYTSCKNSIDFILMNYLKTINEFSLHKDLHSVTSFYQGSIEKLFIDKMNTLEVFIDLAKTNIESNEENILKTNNKIKLYRNNHVEFLLANIKSYNIDTNKQELYLSLDSLKLIDINKQNKSINKEEDFFFDQCIKYAQKDKSSEIRSVVIEKDTSYMENNEKQILINFVQNEIQNHQWPLQEYIGINGHRAWRALKLSADISNFDDSFMLNYHQNFDWIPTDNDYGSFTQRSSIVVRNFERRIVNPKTLYS